MPTVRNVGGPYRLFFYSFDCREPPHVHVQRDKALCKFWLSPVRLTSNRGFSAVELTTIKKLIQVNQVKIFEAWREHCR